MTTLTITKAYVRLYRDTQQMTAYVEWSSGGRTEGIARNWEPVETHMVALFRRAEREGVTVERQTW